MRIMISVNWSRLLGVQCLGIDRSMPVLDVSAMGQLVWDASYSTLFNCGFKLKRVDVCLVCSVAGWNCQRGTKLVTGVALRVDSRPSASDAALEQVGETPHQPRVLAAVLVQDLLGRSLLGGVFGIVPRCYHPYS